MNKRVVCILINCFIATGYINISVAELPSIPTLKVLSQQETQIDEQHKDVKAENLVNKDNDKVDVAKDNDLEANNNDNVVKKEPQGKSLKEEEKNTDIPIINNKNDTQIVKDSGVVIEMSDNNIDRKNGEVETRQIKTPEQIKVEEDTKKQEEEQKQKKMAEEIKKQEEEQKQKKMAEEIKKQEDKERQSRQEQEAINKWLVEKFKKNKTIQDSEMGKLLTTFNLEKALDYDYNTIRYVNGGLLENASEFKIIKQVLKEQLNPEIKKKKEAEEAKKKSIAEAIKKGQVKKPFNGIHLTSLLFFSGEEWICRVNGNIIKSEDRNKKGSNFSIVKVNKTSIVFLLKKNTKAMIKQVEELIEKKYPYYKNYFITEGNGRQHIGVKLFVGQTLDIDTMRITG